MPDVDHRLFCFRLGSVRGRLGASEVGALLKAIWALADRRPVTDTTAEEWQQPAEPVGHAAARSGSRAAAVRGGDCSARGPGARPPGAPPATALPGRHGRSAARPRPPRCHHHVQCAEAGDTAKWAGDQVRRGRRVVGSASFLLCAALLICTWLVIRTFLLGCCLNQLNILYKLTTQLHVDARRGPVLLPGALCRSRLPARRRCAAAWRHCGRCRRQHRALCAGSGRGACNSCCTKPCRGGSSLQQPLAAAACFMDSAAARVISFLPISLLGTNDSNPQACGPTGRVISFEPIPEVAAAARDNVARHAAWCAVRGRPVAPVTVVNAAVGAAAGEAEFTVYAR